MLGKKLRKSDSVLKPTCNKTHRKKSNCSLHVWLHLLFLTLSLFLSFLPQAETTTTFVKEAANLRHDKRLQEVGIVREGRNYELSLRGHIYVTPYLLRVHVFLFYSTEGGVFLLISYVYLNFVPIVFISTCDRENKKDRVRCHK